MTIVSNNPNYQVAQGKNGSIIINYDDPKIKDEECTYTFNKDGSASCVSNAWGTKTELPKDTFVLNDSEKVSAEYAVNCYNDYYNYCKNNNKPLIA